MPRISYRYITQIMSTMLMAALVKTAIAATPLLPPANTGNMYALEKDCDCILEIEPDKMITVLVSNAELLAVMGLGGDIDDYLSFSNNGLVILDDGSAFFTVNAGNDNTGTRHDAVIKRAEDGTLSVLTSFADVLTATGNESADLEGVVVGNDGQLYVVDDYSNFDGDGEPSEFCSLLKIDPITGTVNQFLSCTEFDALGASYYANLGPSIAADENYIYVASDGSPNVVFRVSYAAVAEIFTGGPEVDPLDIYPNATVYLRAFDAPSLPAGNFTLSFTPDGGGIDVTTAAIAWDATAATVEAEVEAVLPEDVTVVGDGSMFSPWSFEISSAYENMYITDVDLVDLSWTANLINFSFLGREAVNAVDHIEAVGTDGVSGVIEADFVLNVQGGFNGENLADISWNVGDSAATVKAALIAAGPLDAADVNVTGTGTLADPWLFEFVGKAAKNRVDINNTDNSVIVGGFPVLVGTIQNAQAFDDPDGFMTRQSNGNLMMDDDSGGHFLFDITAAGDVSIYLSEWDLVRANGGGVNMEGGLAYDGDDNLYVASNAYDEDTFSNATIFKVEPDKSLSRWLTATDVIAITLGNIEDVGFEGIAFVPDCDDDIRIDINPPHNAIALWSWIPFPVVIYGSDSFDVKDIKTRSLRLGPNEAKAKRWPKFYKDIDHDGYKDLVTFYYPKRTGFSLGDTTACISGKADGEQFEACQDITVKRYWWELKH
ncbi:MAG: hypothetical protein HRU20_29560 [Pseudomonadales bacterium]|nr:hypothetical protein [Pseudomonadales bacterium]